MKVAIVTYSLEIGGVESVIFNLSKSFITKGFNVEIIETLREGIWKKYFLDNGFLVTSIIKKPFKTAIRHACQVATYLNTFDVVLINDAPIGQSVLGKLRPDILTFPILHLNLGSMALNASSNKGQWNKIVAVSPFLKEFLLKENSCLNDDDIVCINNGVDTKEFIPFKKDQNPKKRILFIGRLSEQKGIRLIPEIINKIKNHELFDQLDIYGSGPLEEELKIKIAESELSSKVILKGAIAHEAVSKLMPAYDILLMPSSNEGHPIVLLEAMSCGVVPVVTRIPGSTDIVVEHGINGYLSEIGDVGHFISNLIYALENPYLHQLGERASITINSNFSSDKMAQNYISLFESCKDCTTNRTGKFDRSLIGNFPYFPYFSVRPVKKVIKTVKQLLLPDLV